MNAIACGAYLRTLRLRYQITQHEIAILIAQRLGKQARPSLIAQIEQGRSFRGDVLIQMIDILDADVHAIAALYRNRQATREDGVQIAERQALTADPRALVLEQTLS